VLERDGMLMMIDDDRIDLQPGEVIKNRWCVSVPSAAGR
jgi:sulfate adenylyltransferase subunit 2